MTVTNTSSPLGKRIVAGEGPRPNRGYAVELARRAGLTLIGRAKGRRFIALSGEDRILFDVDDDAIPQDAVRDQGSDDQQPPQRAGAAGNSVPAGRDR